MGTLMLKKIILVPVKVLEVQWNLDFSMWLPVLQSGKVQKFSLCLHCGCWHDPDIKVKKMFAQCTLHSTISVCRYECYTPPSVYADMSATLHHPCMQIWVLHSTISVCRYECYTPPSVYADMSATLHHLCMQIWVLHSTIRVCRYECYTPPSVYADMSATLHHQCMQIWVLHSNIRVCRYECYTPTSVYADMSALEAEAGIYGIN